MQKPVPQPRNKYEGRGKFYVNGIPEDAIEDKALAQIIAVGLAQGMIQLSRLGLLEEDLSDWTFHPQRVGNNQPPSKSY